jgi:hypothetical protein
MRGSGSNGEKNEEGKEGAGNLLCVLCVNPKGEAKIVAEFVGLQATPRPADASVAYGTGTLIPLG